MRQVRPWRACPPTNNHKSGRPPANGHPLGGAPTGSGHAGAPIGSGHAGARTDSGHTDGPTDSGKGGAPTDAQSGHAATRRLSLPDVVHRFKSLTTARYRHGVHDLGWPPFPRRLWQRNYYEHIIRNERALKRIRQYILDNPARWDFDIEHPNAWRRDRPPDATAYYASIWEEPA